MKTPKAILLSATVFAAMTATASAQGWNKSIIDAANAEVQAAQYEGLHDVALMVAAEMAAESQRNQRSGVRILERTKAMKAVGFLPQDAANIYEAAVDIRDANGGVHTELVPLSPEEAEKMKMEAAGTAPEEVAAMLEGMSKGMMLLGESLREGIKDSKFSGVLKEESSFEVLKGEGSIEDKCRDYLAILGATMEYARAAGTDEKVQDELMMQSVGIVTETHRNDKRLEEGSIVIDPAAMMLSPVCMLAVSADTMRTPTETYKAVRDRAVEQFNRRAKFEGKEKVDGVTTNHISMSDLSLKQKTDDGGEMTIKRIHVWMDEEYFKRRKMRLEGTVRQDGKTQDIFIERLNQDYRRVGDSYMYEPYKEVLSVGGVLTDKQRGELAKAQEQLKDFDKQLAAMPADQRAMMERMVGPQIEQLRNLTENGAVTIEVVTNKITINPDLGDDGAFYTFFSTRNGGGRLPGGENNVALIQLIQSNLTKLGYAPGPATGEMTDATRAAISKYQADKGLAVTGEASLELAQTLQADVNAK